MEIVCAMTCSVLLGLIHCSTVFAFKCSLFSSVCQDTRSTYIWVFGYWVKIHLSHKRSCISLGLLSRIFYHSVLWPQVSEYGKTHGKGRKVSKLTPLVTTSSLSLQALWILGRADIVHVMVWDLCICQRYGWCSFK